MSELQPWFFVRQRWQPESHVWDGFASIPIETARNEILDLCDGIDHWRKRVEAAEASLAAAPLDALRTAVDLARVTLLHRTDRGTGADAAAVAAAARWLAERGEGQP